ncbi:MAG TPA: ThiF family adenylyltransferase [Gemmatimonadota bacterium]|jgi:adenylyltransferase/sulfurtransferase|nr:ThiF family adenylyltransferase [Gemmatimonadota bacterium]
MTEPSPNIRYVRQSILPEIGAGGQARLAGTHVVVVGCGALGSLQAELLTRAGVGRLTVLDRDFVERSNLQRQVLFTDRDAEQGLPKALAAERALRAINPEIRIDGVVDDLNPGTAAGLLGGADVVADGTDNFETRYLVNDWAVREGVPWVYAAVVGTAGLVMPILPGETACLRCVFETAPAPGSLPTCETAGVLGAAVAVVAGHQNAEILKLALGARDKVTRALLRLDVWETGWTSVATGPPRPDCPVCGARSYEWLEGRRGGRAARLCGRRAIQLLPGEGAPRPRLPELAGRLRPEWEVTLNEHLLRARRGDRTVSVFRDGRAIVEGTADEAEARSLVARVVGA